MHNYKEPQMESKDANTLITRGKAPKLWLSLLWDNLKWNLRMGHLNNKRKSTQALA